VPEEGVAQLIEQLVLVSPEVAARNADRLAAAHDRPRDGDGGADAASDAASDEADVQNGPLERIPTSIGASHA
jgi:hypothetical protein